MLDHDKKISVSPKEIDIAYFFGMVTAHVAELCYISQSKKDCSMNDSARASAPALTLVLCCKTISTVSLTETTELI